MLSTLYLIIEKFNCRSSVWFESILIVYALLKALSKNSLETWDRFSQASTIRIRAIPQLQVSPAIPKNHLLEVGLHQNRVTMALRNLKTSHLLMYYIWLCARTPMSRIHWNSIWMRAVTYDFTLHLRTRDHTTWFWEVSLTAFGYFFWALNISWSRLLASAWRWSTNVVFFSKSSLVSEKLVHSSSKMIK